jgi:polysaccharide chain length determinant protein (PEP-CTERM system associated)
MLPGKKYTPEDLLLIAWRYRWALVLPFVVCLTGGILYAFSLPARYQSSALIQVVPQRVPESYVRPTITAKIEDRLESVKQLILSRTKLESIILQFDLYPEQRKSGLMEDVVERMRNSDIEMRLARGDSFHVNYTSSDPRLAMRVTERLAGLFIEENLRDREMLAESSSQFLESQLALARTRLEETEKKLANYRRQYAGQLPDQVMANLQGVTNTQMQLTQVSESLNRDRDQRLLLSRQIDDITQSPAELPLPPGPAGQETSVSTGRSAVEQLERARNALRAMELRYTAEHPNIINVKRQIAELEKKVDQEQLAQPLSQSASVAPVTVVDRARANRLRELKSQLQQLDLQIANKTAEQGRLQANVAHYQSKVDVAPTRESELIALTRDYNSINEQYQSLLKKNEDAKMAANLERRQGGEQFRLLDPARMPGRPVSPNRPQLIFLGAALGLAIGFGIVALCEYRDRTLRSDDDVMMTLALPVLAVIPRMVSREERQIFRRRWMMISAAGVGTAVCIAVVFVWRFVQWRELLPW